MMDRGVPSLSSIPKEAGWIEVICGSMFSGKTQELIRRLRLATIAKQKVQVFNSALDVPAQGFCLVPAQGAGARGPQEVSDGNR